MDYFKVYFSNFSEGYKLVVVTNETNKIDEFIKDAMYAIPSYKIIIIYRSANTDNLLCYFSNTLLSNGHSLDQIHSRSKEILENILENKKGKSFTKKIDNKK